MQRRSNSSLRNVMFAAIVATPFVPAIARAEPPPPGGTGTTDASGNVNVEESPPAAAVPSRDEPATASREPTLRRGSDGVASSTAPRRRWYGWQTLLLDGVAFSMLASSAYVSNNSASGTLAVGSLVTYAVGAPIVHIAHGHTAKGFGDLGLRVGLPLAFAGVGYAAGSDTCGKSSALICIPSSLAYAAIGFVLGMGTAIALDGAVLAREDAPLIKSETALRPLPKRPALQILPDVELGPNKAALGLRGAF